jgi:hypothetical protein
VGAISLSIVAGCSSDAKPAGTVGASCQKDAECHGGLVCLSQLCVSAEPAAGGGAGGSGGEGGVGPGCNASNTLPAPSTGLIADFADADGGIEIMGGLFDYGGGSDDIGRPSSSIDGGSLHITEDWPASSSPQYVGVFMYFQQCIDASAFSGVSFSISGSFSGCSMQVFATDSAHFDATSGADFASGPPGSYQPQAQLDMSQLSSTPQTVRIAFSSQLGGSPGTPLDPSTLIGMDWQFTIAPADPDSGTASCVAQLTIDDLTFF